MLMGKPPYGRADEVMAGNDANQSAFLQTQRGVVGGVAARAFPTGDRAMKSFKPSFVKIAREKGTSGGANSQYLR